MCLVGRGPGVVPPILRPRSQDSSPAATTDETLPTMVQVVIGMPTVRVINEVVFNSYPLSLSWSIRFHFSFCWMKR